MTPEIRKNISWQRIGDEILIMDTVYQRKAHSLNTSAAFIWELLDGKCTLDEIVSGMCQRYNITPEIAEKDVRESLAQWQKLDLINLL